LKPTKAVDDGVKGLSQSESEVLSGKGDEPDSGGADFLENVGCNLAASFVGARNAETIVASGTGDAMTTWVFDVADDVRMLSALAEVLQSSVVLAGGSQGIEHALTLPGPP
jgi:hypothetical protein